MTSEVLHVLRAGEELGEVSSGPTVAKVLDAARRHATFYVTDHPAEQRVTELMALTRAFFALPREQRMAIAARGAQDSGYRGDDRSAQVLSITRAGRHLHPLFGPIQWPRELPELQPIAERYLDEAYALSMKILATLATGLGLPPSYFEPLFGADAIQNLQLRCYDATPPHNPMPLDAHSDPPPLTLIAQDDVGGLETACDGRFVPVTPLPGALVCQFGAMMARWTDDQCGPNVHRVRSAENTIRFSIVYNLLPHRDAVIERVPTCRARKDSRHAGSLPLDAFLRGHLAYDGAKLPEAMRSRDERGIAETVVEACRQAVEEGSRGAWSLLHASRTAAGVRVRIQAGAHVVELDMSRHEPGRGYYRTIGPFGFSYRGQLPDPALFVVLDQLLPALSASLAAAFTDASPAV